MTKIPVKSLKKLKDKLPPNYAQVIVDRLAEQDVTVSDVLVHKILAGERADHYGIIGEAITIAKEEEEKKQSVITEIENLDKNKKREVY